MSIVATPPPTLQTTLLLPRHLNQSSLLLDPPLNRLGKVIQHFQRRHTNPSIPPRPQRLPQQILVLEEIALFQILLHTRLQPALQRINMDRLLHDPWIQVHPADSLGRGNDFAHGWSHEAVERAVRQAQPSVVQACNGANWIQTGVEDQLLPPVVQDVGRVGALCFSACRVHVHEFFGASFGHSGVDV